jgi:hypothetical protein
LTTARRPFPGFKQLYELSDPPPFPQLCGKLAVDDYADLIGLIRGERRPPRPLTVHLDREDTPQDVIWLENAAGAIISDRVVDLLQQHKLTGWMAYPVTIISPSGATRPGYQGLGVTGRCGSLNWTHRQPLVAASDSSYTLYRGYTFDADSWDGSDFFLWEVSPGFELFADFPFATEAVKIALEHGGVNNVWLRSLTEIESYVCPEDFASFNGEPR